MSDFEVEFRKELARHGIATRRGDGYFGSRFAALPDGMKRRIYAKLRERRLAAELHAAAQNIRHEKRDLCELNGVPFSVFYRRGDRRRVIRKPLEG